LKTGAARIALGVAARHPELVLRIVPCGLTYVRRKRFRSRVLLQFGAPIEITGAKEILDEAGGDERAAARALTDRIEQGIRALTVNAEDWETLRVLDGVRRLYQPPAISLEQRTELSRRFATVYPTVKSHPDVAAMYQRVEAYLDRLRAVGLNDRDLRRRLRASEIAARIAAQLLLMFVWLPLALPGVVLFLPLGMIIRLAGPRFAPRKDVVATTKLVLGIVGTFLILAAIPIVAALRFGAIGALVAIVVLYLSGIATLRVAERGAALRHLVVSLVRLFTLRREAAALRDERAALERDVVAVIERFRPADMVPLFPRTAEKS
jgi:glycerol-3-phosphate O-acyltransferase/dihydroxyacetone phosphate acyltransferase